MARLNEVTSTEKLLDVIRKKTDTTPPEKGDLPKASSSVPLPPRGGGVVAKRKIFPQKSATVGVDIGHEYLRMVKTTKGAEGTPVLVSQKRVAMPPAFDRYSAEFAGFLKAELQSFCGAPDGQQLWAIMSAAHVEVHHTRIPKVPKKQIENVVLWTVKKETPFDEQEVIFDFEVLEEVSDQGVPKLAVMYYTAPKQEIEDTKRLFSRAGWPITGLSVTPFALQNIFRTGWIPDYEGTAAGLFIGNDFSRIDVYSQGNLVMTRGIKAGVSSMIESLMESINERQTSAGAGAEGGRIDKDTARKIIFSLSSESPPITGDELYGLSKKDVWEMVLPALERLVRQVERTFEHFATTPGGEKIDKVYVSAVMDLDRPIAGYVGEQLGIESVVFDPLSLEVTCQVDSDSAFSSISERIAFAPAFGIAISDNDYTPNLIFTYKDKEQVARFKRVNMMIFVVFVISACICAGIFSYQHSAIGQRERTIARLDEQLAKFKPLVDRDMIFSNMNLIKKDMLSAKAYAQRHQGLAVISELSKIVPPDIRLINIKAKLGGMPVNPKKEEAAGSAVPAKEKPILKSIQDSSTQVKPIEVIKEVEIEGLVLGAKKAHETSLANFSMKLDNSPLFQQVKIQKTNEETFRKAALLRFVINMKVEGL